MRRVELVSVHGLCRKFSLLGEAAGAPAGAIAQVMEQKPAPSLKTTGPSTDALRPHLALIEKLILDKAGVMFYPATAMPDGLRVMTG